MTAATEYWAKRCAASDAEIERLRADRELLLTAVKPFASSVYYAVQDLGHYQRAYEAVCAVSAESGGQMSGWLLLKDAPLETVGYVYSQDRSWGRRTDIVGQVHASVDGSRFVSSAAKGFTFSHWHPLLEPPDTL